MKTKLLIFGITGDLSTRKLLPALQQIISTGKFDDLSIIGVSRHQVDVAELLTGSLGNADLSDKVTVFSMDLTDKAAYVKLRSYIDLRDDEQLLAYLSVPPSASTQIVDYMGESGLNGSNVKILFEKPFGMDLESAKDVIAQTARYYNEDQLYRIDHFLAKEMAQNIVSFRSGNAKFGQLWNNKSIKMIEVIAAEQIGIEGRTHFYEQTGALRDIIQGHLMQLLALTIMDIPDQLDWDRLPELRLAALQQLQPAHPELAIRAQYDGYAAEVGNPTSQTETFASLQLLSNAARWEGVPFMLTTGKALSEKTTEVRVHFRKYHASQNNCLVLRIQPNAGVEIELYTKKPGYDHEFENQKLNFTYPADTTLPDAYEQVLVDAMRSRKSLFTGSDEVLRSWEILQPVQHAWTADADAALPLYAPGASLAHIIA
ncbi:MAG: glucose-6-phosphate dehydrogenase [Candidatus Saccharimonadales bacterium]